MTWLTATLAWLQSIENTIWAAFVGVGGALIGGWIGGKIGAQGALAAARLGADRAFVDNIRRDEMARLAQTAAIVQAIRSKLGIAWRQADEVFGPEIRRIGVDRPLTARFVLEGAQFPVYTANASFLGGIDDDNVRSEIISAYADTRSFVDILRANNELAERLDLAQAGHGTGVWRNPVDARAALVTFAPGVLAAFRELEHRHERLMKLTGAWLTAHGKCCSPPNRRTSSARSRL